VSYLDSTADTEWPLTNDAIRAAQRDAEAIRDTCKAALLAAGYTEPQTQHPSSK
jgi:hypothetical protein